MRTKQEKRIRVLEIQRKRDRNRLLKIKECCEPINKILDQIHPKGRKVK